MIGPENPLPLQGGFESAEEYVRSLEEFVTSSQLLQTLCGGVHILDFFTRTPDLYQVILPSDWRYWFQQHEIDDILDFLNKEDLDQFVSIKGQSDQGDDALLW